MWEAELQQVRLAVEGKVYSIGENLSVLDSDKRNFDDNKYEFIILVNCELRRYRHLSDVREKILLKYL